MNRCNALLTTPLAALRLALALGLLAILVLPWTSEAGEPAASVWTPGTVTSDQYESTPTFSPDGREMYFMRADPRFERYWLMWSRCENGRWSPPVPPPFAAGMNVQEADPGLTPDGKRLYFISMRHDPASEDFDIWYVDRTSDGGWSEAHRLPAPVNSRGSELLPRADQHGRLYFGSDRAGGFGKSDIYVATQSRDGTWTVANVGSPVSTAANEYEAEVSRDGRTLVVVADRGDRSHLYRFEREHDRWIEREKIPAYPNVFQVGPLLSPGADRLLFAQADGATSGEIFLIDLAPRVDEQTDEHWPPVCNALW